MKKIRGITISDLIQIKKDKRKFALTIVLLYQTKLYLLLRL